MSGILKSVFYASCTLALLVLGIMPRLEPDQRSGVEKLFDGLVQKAQDYQTDTPWEAEE